MTSRSSRLTSASIVVLVMTAALAAGSVVESPSESREILVVSYPEDGAVTVELEGTTRLPSAFGTATALSRDGRTEIELDVESTKPAFLFGGQYNTYVVWAVSEDGELHNLGELETADGQSAFTGNVPLDRFGLLVTAEPHFLVNRPSDVVVLESTTPAAGSGPVQVSTVAFDVLADPYELERATLSDIETFEPRPLEELESARTAIVLAESSGASQLANDELEEARRALNAAETAQSKEDTARARELSRRAIRLAVEARELSEVRAFEAALKTEKAAHTETLDELTVAIEEAESRMEREKLEAERDELRALIESRAREEAHRLTAEAARRAREAEARALSAEESELEAEQEKAAAEKHRMEAEQEKIAAQQAKLEAEQEKRQAEKVALEARRERDEARAQLQQALAAIADVRESARGLIVDIPNVSFEFGSATLTPEGREMLAKISGVLLVVEDASLSIEGHTDDIGSSEYNTKLSRERAQSVHDYLVGQGIAEDDISTRAFGESQPIASNETPEGRRKNRRVEIVVLEGADFALTSSTTE